MALPPLISRAEAERVLRRAGYSEQETDALLRDLPDPIDTERYATELAKRGLSVSSLTDRRGGSP